MHALISTLSLFAAVAPPAPGHYSAHISWSQESSCSRSWASDQITASFVLDLASDGAVTACRGKQHRHASGSQERDRPERPSRYVMQEQQGFRGTWERDGDWIDVRLGLDPDACPQRRGYTNREPEPWHLRCKTARPAHDANLPAGSDLLACQWVDPVYSEELGYKIFGVMEGQWFLLGAGHGLRIQQHDQGFVAMEDVLSIRVARTPVRPDDWTRPVPPPSAPPADRPPNGLAPPAAAPPARAE